MGSTHGRRRLVRTHARALSDQSPPAARAFGPIAASAELPLRMFQLEGGMAESRVSCEESEAERLPTLASLLQTSPSPPCDLGRRRSSPPALKAGSAQEVVVVVSSGSDEDEEVVPLPERIKRRMEARNAGFEVSRGSQRSTQGGERPSLCPLPASQSDSTAQPNTPLVSGTSPETSPLSKKVNHSQKERDAACQSWQRRKEREALRRQKEEEKERKRALAKMLKAQRPGECQKYITVVLDPGTCPHSLCLPYIASCLLCVEA